MIKSKSKSQTNKPTINKPINFYENMDKKFLPKKHNPY